MEDQPSDEPAGVGPDEPADEQLLTVRAQSVGDALARAGGRAVVVDLTAVDFLGSHGLTALSMAAVDAQARREPLRLVVDRNRPVIRSLEIAGLDHLLALFFTVEEALAR